MGGLFSAIHQYCYGNPKLKCLMLGLDSAGKTTILFKLKLGEIFTTLPSIGYEVETLVYKGLSLYVWDLGGPDRLRPTYEHYFDGAKALIYVVDSNNEKRIREAREELDRILDHPVFSGRSPLLIFANKQDLPYAMSTDEITRELGLYLRHERPWHVQKICALTGEGLKEGLNWLAESLSR